MAPIFFLGGDLYLQLYEHQKKAVARLKNGNILMSKSSIDSAIDNAINRKKKFNEKIFIERM